MGVVETIIALNKQANEAMDNVKRVLSYETCMYCDKPTGNSFVCDECQGKSEAQETE